MALSNEKMKFRIYGADGVRNDQHDYGAQHGGDGSVKQLKGDEHIGEDKHNGGNPESRTEMPLQCHVFADIKVVSVLGQILPMNGKSGPFKAGSTGLYLNG